MAMLEDPLSALKIACIGFTVFDAYLPLNSYDAIFVPIILVLAVTAAVDKLR